MLSHLDLHALVSVPMFPCCTRMTWQTSRGVRIPIQVCETPMPALVPLSLPTSGKQLASRKPCKPNTYQLSSLYVWVTYKLLEFNSVLKKKKKKIAYLVWIVSKGLTTNKQKNPMLLKYLSCLVKIYSIFYWITHSQLNFQSFYLVSVCQELCQMLCL